jgi:hypothetical protein
MGEVLTRTADGHEVEIGAIYWNYDYRQCRVTGVSHDEPEASRGVESGRLVRWYTVEGLGDGRRSIFDGSRLSRRRPF